jgi:ankyrin repeat protein
MASILARHRNTNACKTTDFAELSLQTSGQIASGKTTYGALGLYQNNGNNIMSDLETGDIESCPGELLFEMAVAKGLNATRINGIDYDGMLRLASKALKAKNPSLAGAGVIAQMFSALSTTTHPPPPMAQEDLVTTLHIAVESGSISAKPTLEALAPHRLHQAIIDFRKSGGYNQERLLLLQHPRNLAAFLLAEEDEVTLVSTILSYKELRSTRNKALHIAAMLGKHQLIQVLVKEPGVVIDSTNTAGETPLYKACLAGQYRSVKILIDNGADPSIRVSPLRISCLQWLFAFSSDDMEKVASLLVSRGLSIQARVLPAVESAPNIYKWTASMHFPFHWPAGTPLHWAAHAESPDAVDVLLRLGAHVEEFDMMNDPGAQTALSMAMYWGHVKMVSHLLAKGANAARVDGRGCFQLHMVVGDRSLHNSLFSLARRFAQWCYHGSFENALASTRFCVAAITNAGVSVDCERPMGRTSSNFTPLADAVHRGDAVGVIALLEKGANADVLEDYSEQLPLHI